MKKFLKLITLVFCFSTFAFGQEQTPPDDEIIRISSKLVLVDALVTDKNGNQVTDLKPEDFELLQDGKAQEITNFSYVNGENKLSAAAAASGKKSLPLPPVSGRSAAGRIITFVIDDGNCLATPEGLEIARDGVRKFIGEQMLANDRVAIYRTRGGSNLLQMYTSNKEVLRRIVGKVRWFPSACGSAFEAAKNDTLDGTSRTFDNDSTKRFKADISNQERNNQVKGSLGVLEFLIDRLKPLPQRKVVFFVSEGIPIPLDPKETTVFDALRVVADKASRASVVFYTISEKGLTVPGMMTAQDETSGDIGEARIEEERSLNSGLGFLADQTGGRFVRNKNFIDADIRNILQTENGYYLLGYQPADGTFDGKDFHKIQVKLKRGDLRISSRKGFFGRDDEKRQTKNKTAESPLYQAISSPFQENNIDIRLTTLVGGDAKTGNYVRALFHINGADLTFADEANGGKKVVLDVVAVLLDEKGKVVEELNRTYPIRIPAAGVETVKRNGLDYSTDLPVKKPGFYSFRLAVRDETSKRLASAGDYVEILDAKKRNFAVANLLTTDITKDGKPLVPKIRQTESAFAPVYTTTVPAIRQYRAGAPFAYIYDVYNAETDKSNNQPKLTVQYRLFRNGALLVEGKEKTVEIESQIDASSIRGYGFLKLNENAEVGEYILQLIVNDRIAGKTSTQWIDFEVVK